MCMKKIERCAVDGGALCNNPVNYFQNAMEVEECEIIETAGDQMHHELVSDIASRNSNKTIVGFYTVRYEY